MKNLYKVLLIFLFNCARQTVNTSKKIDEAARDNVVIKDYNLTLKSFTEEKDSTISLEWNKLENVSVYNIYLLLKNSDEDNYERYLLKGSISNNITSYTFKKNKDKEIIFYQVEALLNNGEKVISNKSKLIINKKNKFNIDNSNSSSALEFNFQMLSERRNVKYLKANAIPYDIFKFRELSKGFEIYGKDYGDKGTECDIACINDSNELMFFISKTKINNPNTPIEVYQNLRDKNINDLTEAETKIIRTLKIEENFRKSGTEPKDSINVIPKNTKFIIVKKYKTDTEEEFLCSQEIEKLEEPKIVESYYDADISNLKRKVKVFVKWDKIEGAIDYKIAIRNATNKKVFTECIQTNYIIMEIDIDPKLDNQLTVVRLVALNDNFESKKAVADIEPKKSTISILERNLNEFLKKYNVELDENIKENLLELPAVKKGKLNFENCSNFTKILILSLCNNPDFRVKDLSDYKSDILEEILKFKTEVDKASNKSKDDEIYNFFLNELRKIYKKVSNGTTELLKNEDHLEYTTGDYIFNCTLSIASVFSQFNYDENLRRDKCVNEIRNSLQIWGEIKANAHIIGGDYGGNDHTLVNESNKRCIKNYCLDIYYLLKKETNIDEKEHYMKLFIEAFSNCVSGMFERLAYISNSLFLKQNKNKSHLEGVIEEVLLEFREDLFKRKVMDIIKNKKYSQSNENVMYINWVRKGVSNELKLFPAEYKARLTHQLELLDVGQDKEDFYKKFILDFKKDYYHSLIKKLKEEFEIDKQRILPMIHTILKENFLYLGEDEYSTTLFFRNHLIEKNAKKQEVVTTKGILAILARKGVITIKLK